MGQQGCFVCRAGGVRCHILIGTVPGRGACRASPWVQDGVVIRLVLNEAGKRVEITAEDEQRATSGVLDLLARRFGPISEGPILCPDGGHIQAKAVPLKWKDQLN